jgi:transmembrane sensor
MTNPISCEHDAEAAQKVRMRAATWLQRRQFWNWSEADQIELDRWLAESSSHQVAYIRIKAVWNRTERLTALRHSANPSRKNGSRFGRTIFAHAIAAAAIVALIGFTGVRYLTGTAGTTWTTSVGGRRALALLDGSKIELNTNTVLRITDDQRIAWLDRGEAYFQIKHDHARPFVVIASGRRVVDIGTKFLVRDNGNKLEVALVEGRARIESEKARANGQTAILTPGDVAIAAGGSF